jgi:twitching motility protein PilT
VEDPIEFVYESKRCILRQREVGASTRGFGSALKHALRQDPDVILIGEMRDIETIQAAVNIAETGHLVLATLHTTDAVQSINRIIDVKMPEKTPQKISAWQYASEGTQLAVTLLLGLYIGNKLDQHWETSPWCLLAGAAVGLVSGLYNFLRRFLSKS